MLEALTTEVVLSLAMVGASALAIGGVLLAVKQTQPQTVTCDVDAVVRNAPYHRLHNIVPLDGG